MNIYMISVAIFAIAAYYWAWRTIKRNKKKFDILKDDSFVIQRSYIDKDGTLVVTHEEEVKILSPENEKKIEKDLEEIGVSLKRLHTYVLLIVFLVIIFLLLPKT